MGARKRVSRAVVSFTILLCAGLLAPTFASATSRNLETSIPTGEGPVALAVDDSNGDIYVSEFVEETLLNVSRFDSTGAPKNFTAGPNAGTNKLTGFFSPGLGASQVAVDSNSGRIYVTNLSTIEVFENTGEPLTTLNGSSTPAGEFTPAACGVAVDQSTGNVYVGAFGAVWRYTPSGGSIAESDFSGGITPPMATCNVAAAQGVVYAANTFEVGEVRAFNDSDFATGEPPSPSSTLIDEGGTAVYADSANADAYVDKGNVIDVSDSTGADLYSFGSGDFGSSTGVAVMPSPGKAYVSDAENEEVDVYSPVIETGFQLSIQKTGTGSGTVVSSPPGINCGLACSASFDEGQVVELVATADVISEFIGWSTVAGDSGTCTGTTSPCEVTMEEAVELEAEFQPLPIPDVDAVSPTEGPTAGGTLVEITGTGLGAAAKVEFGGISVDDSEFISNTKTKIELKSPQHSAGTFPVIVTTGGGTSPDTPDDDYTYIAPPAVTGLSPSSGPVSGGNEVEIIGTRLGEASKVEFGTTVVEDSEFIENTETTIVLNAPAHEVGKVHVRVTTIGGISGKFAVDQYTFVGPAALSVGTAGTGSGSVTCDGGTCASTYPFGTQVTLAAAPSAGSSFAGWSGGGCTGTGPCVVILEANTAVTATFNTNPPPPPPPPPPGTPEVAPTASFSGGKAELEITCKGQGPCEATVTLKAKVNGKMKVIGKASFSLAAGETKTVKVQITNGKVKKRLNEGKTVNAKLSGGPGLNGKSVKISK
jgi:DNA-binding beta-propeller fold protein YncE